MKSFRIKETQSLTLNLIVSRDLEETVETSRLSHTMNYLKA